MRPALLESTLTHLGEPRRGKVREVYDLGSQLLMVSTDRISAFDVIMANGIPDKGRVLTQMSAFWFESLGHLVPHHLVSVDDQAVDEAVGAEHPELHGRTMLVRKAPTIPIECVARGYLAGSWWKDYAAGQRELHGVTLPDGLHNASRLSEPIFTPATKAESGHDENISFAQAADLIGTDLATQLRDWTITLYLEAAKHAESCGLILADTKFEFGMTDEGPIWIDEALTPDSSRYWEASTYTTGSNPPSFDKQFVRDYLETLDWDKTPPGPELPDDIVTKTRDKYLDAFRRITGHDLAL